MLNAEHGEGDIIFVDVLHQVEARCKIYTNTMPNHVKMSRRIAMFTDQDIFITNTTSTYQNIPQDCKLVGTEFDQDYQPDSIHLNITDDGTFWIGATIGFKRNINPIGNLDDIVTSIY
jgi:hypothetical protein